MSLELDKLKKSKHAVAGMFFFLERNFLPPVDTSPKESFNYATEIGDPYLQRYTFDANNELRIYRSYFNYPYFDRENVGIFWQVSVCGYPLVSFNSDWFDLWEGSSINSALKWENEKITPKFKPFILEAATELAQVLIERKAHQLAMQIKKEEETRADYEQYQRILTRLFKQKQKS